eukprot:6311700-Amphidinium_carterae.1
MTYRSIGRDTELANRLTVSKHWNQTLAYSVHKLYMAHALENEVPEDQHPTLTQPAPVIIHGYTGTPAFSMDEPPAAAIHLVYRDPQREYIDTDERR